eukprot:CAMPEP_0197913740 /NCGR_PEP_ID=MMETSP1439-20131203/77156_1 /TAXON_ID=66791 /ORGANISM="Gonyaulax spinifera, Strain CCMP409" /LENGTH=39 /DNA_ID= /DNA_START= /DNA_END= /DNA_ORIENTATION=
MEAAQDPVVLRSTTIAATGSDRMAPISLQGPGMAGVETP